MQPPLKTGVPSLRQYACVLLCAVSSTYLFQCMADVAFIWFILGSHKLFQRIIRHGNTAGSGAEKKMCKLGLLAMP